MAMVTVAVELTHSQLRLLRFFAGQGDEPSSVRSRTYTALVVQGLIQNDSGSLRYEITELGRHTVMALDRQQDTVSK
jgi:hypothetical protein